MNLLLFSSETMRRDTRYIYIWVTVSAGVFFPECMYSNITIQIHLATRVVIP